MAKKVDAIGKEFIIEGNSFYSSLARPNTKGNFASNCYEVGITDISLKFKKGEDEKIKEEITNYINEHTKENEEQGVSVFKIKNSRFPIPVYKQDGTTRIENPRVSNGTKIIVRCKFNYSVDYSTNYVSAIAVKINEEYKEFNPFNDTNDFE